MNIFVYIHTISVWGVGCIRPKYKFIIVQREDYRRNIRRNLRPRRTYSTPTLKHSEYQQLYQQVHGDGLCGRICCNV